MNHKLIPTLLGAAALSILGLTPALAEYPEKPITIIYPWPAGDPTTAIMRTIGEMASEKLGQPIVVNSITGAGGTKALTAGATADADGYTIVSNWVAAQVGAKLFNPDLPFDNDSFVPIGNVYGIPFTITVAIDHPANTISEFVEWARMQDAPLNYGVCAPQSVPRLIGEQFMQSAALDYNPIPFGGGCGGENITGLLNGSLDVSVGIVPLTNVFKGQIKHLGLITDDPHPLAPDLQTAKDSGYPIGWGSAVLGWGGLAVPAGTPDDVVAVLQETFGEVLQGDALKESLAGQAAIINYLGPDDFQDLWGSSSSLLAPAVDAILISQ